MMLADGELGAVSGVKDVDWSSMTKMMKGGYFGHSGWGGSWLGGFHLILGLITWLALIAFLVAATRYFWKKAGK